MAEKEHLSAIASKMRDSKAQMVCLTPLIRLLNPFINIVCFFGLFPVKHSKCRFSNVLHYTIITVLIFFDLYLTTFKLVSIVASMLKRITASSCVQLAVFIFFYVALSCVIFVARTGQKEKLEQFSKLLYQATEQAALEKRFVYMRRKVRACAALVLSLVISIAAFFPLVYSELANNWPAAPSFRTLLFVDAWYTKIFVIIVFALNAIAYGMWLLTYFTICECLKEEFRYVNKKLRNTDIRETEIFKKIALEHSRLLKCLNFLHDYLSIYVFVCLAALTIIATIFSYLLMLNIALPFRLLAGFWLISIIIIAFVFCNSAETLHSATYKTGGLIAQQASVDMYFTALGFFVVSKEALLALFSFIATYVVILLQTPKIMDPLLVTENHDLNASFSEGS